MSAFEADRFNHSRTSPRDKNVRQWLVVSASGRLKCVNSQSAILALRNRRLAIAFIPPLPEESLQQIRATASQHSAFHFHVVIELGVIQHLHD